MPFNYYYIFFSFHNQLPAEVGVDSILGVVPAEVGNIQKAELGVGVGSLEEEPEVH